MPRQVPTALHDELTEYSSLLRALRTTRTLDVTAHLTHRPQPGNDAEPSTSTGDKRKRSLSPDTPHWRKRDQWTRWPLLAKDVPPPEWSFHDELGAMVKQILAPIDFDSDRDSDASLEEGDLYSMDDVDSEDDTDSEDEEETYMQHLTELLTPVVENYLESLFALISAHTVARSDAMQNRIEPFDWRDLVNILGSPAALHLVDETMLQNLITKMQIICETTPASTSSSIPPPPSDLALHKHRLAKASQLRLSRLLSSQTAGLFEQKLPPPGHRYMTVNQINIKLAKTKRRTKTDSTTKMETASATTSESEERDDSQVEEHSQRGDDDLEWNSETQTESDSEG